VSKGVGAGEIEDYRGCVEEALTEEGKLEAELSPEAIEQKQRRLSDFFEETGKQEEAPEKLYPKVNLAERRRAMQEALYVQAPLIKIPLDYIRYCFFKKIVVIFYRFLSEYLLPLY
jgi:hypothetical protein